MVLSASRRSQREAGLVYSGFHQYFAHVRYREHYTRLIVGHVLHAKLASDRLRRMRVTFLSPLPLHKSRNFASNLGLGIALSWCSFR